MVVPEHVPWLGCTEISVKLAGRVSFKITPVASCGPSLKAVAVKLRLPPPPGVYLTRLALTDFRSYAAAELDLGLGVTTLLGANGQGKTNVVEAVAYLATLGSHRVASDAPLVRRGADRAILRATVTSADRDSLIEIEINPGHANRARLNRVPVRPRQVLGALRTVLFAPEDLALVKGDPDGRRRYLDDLLVATAPRYAGVRADYERVLRQRTALLKSLRGRAGARMYAGAGGRSPGDDPGEDQPRNGWGDESGSEGSGEIAGAADADGGTGRTTLTGPAGRHARRLGRAPGHYGRGVAGCQDQPDACAPPARRPVLRRGGRRCGRDRDWVPPVVQ